MNLTYVKNCLYTENQKIEDITKKWETPFYLYSEKVIIENYQEFESTIKEYGLDGQICFALKANANLEILKILAKLGSGADIVSIGELKRALDAGIDASKIVFSGVGKTEKEIRYAIQSNIYAFNVESFDELEVINKLAKEFNKKIDVALRLNPMVQVKTHKHISTGHKTHKFGILAQDIIEALNNKKYWSNINLIGLSMHIGSQLTCLDATETALIKLCECAKKISLPLQFLDVGGGLGIDYSRNESSKVATTKQYIELVSKTINKHYPHKIKVLFEPGRKIMASTGLFVTSVIRTKTSEGNHFTIVDGGMNDFVRPSLYEAFHMIYPSKESKDLILTDVVGPICETSDCFAQKRLLPKLQPGDFFVIADTGAYGFSMSSNYNLRVRPKELLIKTSNEVIIINKIEVIDDLF